MEIFSTIESNLNNLITRFRSSNNNYVLTINGIDVGFKKEEIDFNVSPNSWVEGRCGSGAVHEPGLVSTIYALSKVFGDSKVVFYDVGALFGYHAFIAHEFFSNVKCVVVEGNPLSSNYIKNNAKGKRVSVLNVVLGLRNEYKKYLVNGFQFIPAATLRFYRVLIKKWLKLNFLGHGERYPIKIYEIETLVLKDIFMDQDFDSVEIMKVDTEGYQAVFIPPAIDLLAERGVIVLMELDSPKQMAKFNSSNDALVKMFIDKDYEAYWMDHKTSEAKLNKIVEISKGRDRNSLVVFIPSKYAN